MNTLTDSKTDKHYEYLSKLASKMQGIAMCISDGARIQYECPEDMKSSLLEASHALDSNAIRVHKKRDGILMITARGHSRFMTFREKVAFWLLKGKTEIRP